MSTPSRSEQDNRVLVHLDRLLEERDMTLTELAERVGITVVNLSVLKNGRAKAVRFNTLTRICDALGCQPGDILSVQSERDAAVPGDTTTSSSTTL